MEMRTNPGTIYLVGTGPGATNLITVKGLALVREADAIVGDVLHEAQLLQEVRPEVEIHDVGCRSARNKVPQEQVNRLLLELARQGKTVVRLWPGDPFVFGRAAQEMAAAQQAGIRFELVPGVSSAIAAPAYAGVPVTHWEYATSFAVVTGYESKNPAVRPDWTALAGMETLVILMPLDDLPNIVARLLAAGRATDTPALVVQQGTLPQQKQALATLGTIVEAVETNQIEHPAIVIVGPVAELANELHWFEAGDTYPLLGRRVLVTRPTHQAADFMASLRALGAEPISFPTIEIRPTEDTRPLDEAIRRLGAWRPAPGLAEGLANGESNPQSAYDWLVLTSVNGVAAFWQRLQCAGLDSRCLASTKIAAIGPATSAALTQRSITPDLVPQIYTAEGVLEAFDQAGPVAGRRFLLARADIARKTLAEGLVERGALVDEVTAYCTVPIEHGPPPPPADIVTFTSSSTVQGYVNCLAGRSPATVLKDSQVVCIGPVTAATAEELGVPLSAVAEKYTIDGLLDILKKLFTEHC
jgi:uroporphyrinogen III methyltransferase/synthase